MAAETGAREDGNEELETEPSLTEIKGILHDIQQSISSIVKDKKSLKEDLAHLKSSFSSQAQEIKKLKESLETYKNENAALKTELETTKESLAKQIDERVRPTRRIRTVFPQELDRNSWDPGKCL